MYNDASPIITRVGQLLASGAYRAGVLVDNNDVESGFTRNFVSQLDLIRADDQAESLPRIGLADEELGGCRDADILLEWDGWFRRMHNRWLDCRVMEVIYPAPVRTDPQPFVGCHQPQGFPFDFSN